MDGWHGAWIGVTGHGWVFAEPAILGVKRGRARPSVEPLRCAPPRLPHTTTTASPPNYLQVSALLNSYLARFALAPVFTPADAVHALTPVPGVVHAYVAEGPDGGPVVGGGGGWKGRGWGSDLDGVGGVEGDWRRGWWLRPTP